MTRIEWISSLSAAFLLASGATASAGCLSESCGGAGNGGNNILSGPSTIIVPPVVLQQIETASRPMQFAPAAPEDDGPGEPLAALGIVPTGGIGSVGELDAGDAAWGQIAPEHSGKLPLGMARLQPALHKRPLPARTEIALSTHLSIEVPAVVRPTGVPGIADSSTGDGNRALWFSTH